MNQQMIEAMTEEEYSFYLAHGVSNDASLQLQEILDDLMLEYIEM